VRPDSVEVIGILTKLTPEEIFWKEIGHLTDFGKWPKRSLIGNVPGASPRALLRPL
jgi:predicted DNA-binding ribbon-helix-helix protein